MAYDPEGKSIAVGTFDGSIKLYSPFTGKQTQVLNPPAVSGQEVTPITSVRWRPQWSGQNLRASSILMATTSDGVIQHWHISSNKLISEDKSHKINGNNLCCADYTRDGKKLIVAGEDRKVYVYDET